MKGQSEKNKLSGKISLIFLTGGPFEMGVIQPIRMESVVVPYGRNKKKKQEETENRKRQKTGREKKRTTEKQKQNKFIIKEKKGHV